MNIFLGILLLIGALFLVVAVLLQNGKSKGTGVVTGGAETFFGKTKGKALDKKLALLTTIVAIVFVLLVIIVFVTQEFKSFEGSTNPTTSGSGSGSGLISDILTNDTGDLTEDVADLTEDVDTSLVGDIE